MGWTAQVQFTVGKAISLLHSIQIDSGAHAASYQMCSGAISPGVKLSARNADLLPLSSAKVKRDGAVPHFPICPCGIVVN
jgi:hypothetical protein